MLNELYDQAWASPEITSKLHDEVIQCPCSPLLLHCLLSPRPQLCPCEEFLSFPTWKRKLGPDLSMSLHSIQALQKIGQPYYSPFLGCP